MLKKEYKIIEEFIKKPWKKYTFKEIKKLSGKSSESYVYNSLKKFVKEGVLKEERVSNIVLYSINFGSFKSLIYFGFILEYISWGKKNIPYKTIEELFLNIPTDFFIFIITGSYAKNTQNRNSDLDVVIICDNSFEPKKIYSELKYYCEISIPKIHLYVFKGKEFLNMLLDNKENYGRELARNNLVLYGGGEYFKIISEAIKNGFIG